MHLILLLSSAKRTNIDITMITTPPALLGTARRIAYMWRKYHSGLICSGETILLASE